MEQVEELGKNIAEGIIRIGLEADFNSVSCSATNGFVTIGIGNWELNKADELLDNIPGGEHFSDRPYKEIADHNEIEDLQRLLSSEEGIRAQKKMMEDSATNFAIDLKRFSNLTNKLCIVYAGMWCTRSTSDVIQFLKRYGKNININNIKELHGIFSEYYSDFVFHKKNDPEVTDKANKIYRYVLTEIL